MKILEVITLGEAGGAQTVMVDLIKGFVDHRTDIEIDVVCGSGKFLPDALYPWFKGHLFQISSLVRSINPWQDFRALQFLINLCKTEKYDLVHCHSSKASWLARVAAWYAGIPRVAMTVHGVSFHPGNSALTRALYKNVEKFVLPLASDYIFVSQNDLKSYQSLGLKTDKGVLIPNGRPEQPRPAKNLRKLMGIAAERPIVCMAARLADVKNPLSFIRIAKLVRQQYPSNSVHPCFVLIGDGPLFTDCRDLVRQEGLEDWVYLTGHMEDASQCFWDADIVMLTSRYEACPLVVIEAMTAGVPVVASNVGGTGLVVSHGKTGYLYSANNEAEAAGYLLKLLANRELKQNMSIQSRNVYGQKFTVEKMVNEYIQHFGL